MSVTRSPTGSGLGVGRSDSQPNLTSNNPLSEMPESYRGALRNKRKFTDDYEIVLTELSEMRKQMAQMMTMLVTLTTNQKDAMDNMSKDITSIKQNLSNIKSTTDSLSSEQKSIKLDITNLSNKNLSTENKIEALESKVKLLKISPASSSLSSDEDIMAELTDRELRSKNIILIGVPEPESKEREERMNLDKSEVIKISKLIDVECAEPTKTFRLGIYRPDKIRLMKVCFKSQETAKAILRNRNFLKSDTIKIFSDQTPKQQENLKNIKEELKHRTDSGENNLTIKYIKGVPKIVGSQFNNYKQ